MTQSDSASRLSPALLYWTPPILGWRLQLPPDDGLLVDDRDEDRRHGLQAEFAARCGTGTDRADAPAAEQSQGGRALVVRRSSRGCLLGSTSPPSLVEPEVLQHLGQYVLLLRDGADAVTAVDCDSEFGLSEANADRRREGEWQCKAR